MTVMTTGDLNATHLGQRFTITSHNATWSITGRLYDIEHTSDLNTVVDFGGDVTREDITRPETILTIGPFTFTTIGTETVTTEEHR